MSALLLDRSLIKPPPPAFAPSFGAASALARRSSVRRRQSRGVRTRLRSQLRRGTAPGLPRHSEAKAGRAMAKLMLWVAPFCLCFQPSTLYPQSVETNRVLELDGKGSYVQLPDGIFHDLSEGTVEA